MSQAMLASAVFGRDEDDSEMDLRQRDVDEAVTLLLWILDGRHPIPLTPEFSVVVLDIR